MSRRRKFSKILHGRFTAMPHYILDCVAYKALPPLARCIYWHLHRIAGVAGEKNGELFYSVRSAAEDHAVAPNTAMKAFDQLQAKGFIVPVRIGYLGVEGQGKATKWRLTHFSTGPGKLPTRDFERWSAGNDFPVAKKQNPISKTKAPPYQSLTHSAQSRPKIGAPCINNCNVSGFCEDEPVAANETYKDLPSTTGQPRVRVIQGGRDS